MFKQTIQASGFGKKTYAKPQMKAYQVNAAAILAGSGTTPSTTSTQNEEYTTESTDSWFQ